MQGFPHGEVQDLVNILAAIAYIENLRLVASSFALFADQFDVGEELHFHRDRAVALAGFAAASGNVEGKMPGGKASLLGLGKGSKEVADAVEGLDVGNRIGARRSADRGLVDQNDVVNEIVALDSAPIRRRDRLSVGLPLGGGQGLKQHVMQQG